MKIKDKPISVQEYYKKMREDNLRKREDYNQLKQELIDKINNLYVEIDKSKDVYLKEFNLDLDKCNEYKTNQYIDGKFLKVAKGAYMNRGNNYELVSILYDLYRLAKLQLDVYNLYKAIELNEKTLALSLKQYTEIIKTFYTEVHSQMILNGYGYVFEGVIGWICINRCKLGKTKPRIDYKATKLKEAELKANGARIYDKTEAEWCAKRGIEYKAEDKRVFQNLEYVYEVPLISCRLPNATKLKLEMSDYRYHRLRGLTNDDLIKSCNSDTKKICKLPVDLKTKLTMCDKVDKILYTKFIRNENQESIAAGAVNRKNRQRL